MNNKFCVQGVKIFELNTERYSNTKIEAKAGTIRQCDFNAKFQQTQCKQHLCVKQR